MAEYIDRKKLIEAVYKADTDVSNMYWDTGYSLCKVEKIIDSIPAADVAPVRHGEWIFERETGTGYYYAHCSECGFRDVFNVEKSGPPYCSMCGAWMTISNSRKLPDAMCAMESARCFCGMEKATIIV